MKLHWPSFILFLVCFMVIAGVLFSLHQYYWTWKYWACVVSMIFIFNAGVMKGEWNVRRS